MFLDKISRHSQVVEGFRFAELMITPLLFVEGVVLLASSVGDLQLTRVVCSEATDLEVLNLISEVTVLFQKRMK